MAAPTKQQVLDRRQALDQVVVDAEARKVHGAMQRIVREQVAARRQLVADCEAAAGHVFAQHDIECLFCGAPKDAAARQVEHNLTRVA